MDVSSDFGEIASLKYSKALDFFKAGEYTQAVAVLKEDLAQEPDKHGFYALGKVFLAAENDYVPATKALLEAVKIDKFYHEALSLLGDVYFVCGQGIAAIECHAQAVAIDPANEDYKQKLINVVSILTYKKTNPNLKGVLIECLESDQVDMVFMGSAWLSMIRRDASIGPYFKLSKQKDYSSYKKNMERFPNCDGLINPFFLTGLGKFIVPNLTFERWIKCLRHYLLESVVGQRNLFSDESDIELITCALSRYCFLTDYVMSCSPEEAELLDALSKKINEEAPNPALSDLACYGCYRLIYALPKAKEIAAGLKGGNHVSQIPKSQIEEYFAQQEILKEIETLGKIEDKTSQAVQAQYETFPYPRWNVTSKELFDLQIEGYLKDSKAEILIAGCGTGKEAIQMAYAFPDAQITAVDLSKTSLAYAIFKARQLGIENIRFYQADILALADLEDWAGRFDYIASAGVLHHMKDPKAGWQVLCGLLKDDGLMRIGLYSHCARWAINEAHNVIQEKNIGSDGSSISVFKDNITSYLKHKTIKKLEGIIDYYNLSECRDLLFHVQEHQFDLLQVKEHLNTLGLEFLKFYLDKKTLVKYQNQNAKIDPEGTNLEVWDAWEKKNPETFISMYQFWCKKIS